MGKLTAACGAGVDVGGEPGSAAQCWASGYTRLNQIPDTSDFDGDIEGLCQRFYAENIGRPGLLPGRYFPLLLIGYFEGADAERIAWRAADSFAVREFLGLGAAGSSAGSFDNLAHAPLDRRGDA